jgi:hypothetical protein
LYFPVSVTCELKSYNSSGEDTERQKNIEKVVGELALYIEQTELDEDMIQG